MLFSAEDPHRPGVPVAGQVIHLEKDQGARHVSDNAAPDERATSISETGSIRVTLRGSMRSTCDKTGQPPVTYGRSDVDSAASP